VFRIGRLSVLVVAPVDHRLHVQAGEAHVQGTLDANVRSEITK
jgi:hypothetical protein